MIAAHFVPSVEESNKLMIVLHGKGDSWKPFEDFGEELGMPEMNFLLLNAPQKFMGGYSWYKEPPKMKDEILQIRAQMLELLQEVIASGWKPENIFLFGFSQGALIVSDLLMNANLKFAGVIGISGYFHFYPRWESKLSTQVQKTPLLFTHGKRDEILPIKTTEFGVQKLMQAGFSDVTWNQTNKKHVLEESEYPVLKHWIRSKYLPDESVQSSSALTEAPVLPPASAFAHNLVESQLPVDPGSSSAADQ